MFRARRAIPQVCARLRNRPLWATEVRAEDLEARRKRIKRATGEYLACHLDGKVLILSTVQVPGASSVTSPEAVKAVMEPWLQPGQSAPGERRLSRSRGWVGGLASSNGKDGGDMAQGGQTDGFELVLEQAPELVLKVLRDLASVSLSPADFLNYGPQDEDLARSPYSMVGKATVLLCDTALELLEELAAGRPDTQGQLRVTW